MKGPNRTMNESAKTPFDAESPMWQLWWDFLSKTTGAGMSFPPGSAPPETLRSARSEMFRVWADGWQEYLRSPEFLSAMGKSLEVSLKARQQWVEQAGQAQHEMQGVSRQDFDRLLRTLRQFEERTEGRLEELAAAVADLAARLQKPEETPAKDQAG